MMNYISYALLISIFYLSGCSQRTHTTMCPNKPLKFGTPRYYATMKTYKVLGNYYSPRNVSVGEKMYGISSWYGPNFHGKCTSSGEKYNMYARTAAHKTLPMNTIVRVKNLQNGMSTVVRINDRGPFVGGRIIDCSYRAGKEIGLDKMGISRVELEVLHIDNDTSLVKKPAVKKIMTNKVNKNIAIQLGAFKNYEGAQRLKQYYQHKYLSYYPEIHVVNTADGKRLYRVMLLGFHTKDEANLFKENIITMI